MKKIYYSGWLLITLFIFSSAALQAQSWSGWEKRFRTINTHTGDSTAAFLKDIYHTPGGGYIAVGCFYNYDPAGSLNDLKDIILVRADDSGTILFEKHYDFGLDENNVQFVPVHTGGYAMLVSGDSSVVVLMDNVGDIVSVKGIEGNGKEIIQTSDGGFAVAATYLDGFDIKSLMVKLDSSANTVWTIKLDTICSVNAITQTTDGSYVLAGAQTEHLSNFNTRNIILLWKINAYGQTVWVNTSTSIFNSTNYSEIAEDVLELPSGDLMISVSMEDASYYPAGAGLVTLDQNGNMPVIYYTSNLSASSFEPTNDGGWIVIGGKYNYTQSLNFYSYIAKLDSNFVEEWVYEEYDEGSFSKVRSTADGAFIVCGHLNWRGVLLRLSNNGTVNLDKIQSFPEFRTSVSPNPFSDITNIVVSTKQFQDLTLRLYTIAGRHLRTIQTRATNTLQLSREGLHAGVYLYQLEGDGVLVGTGKVVVE